MIFFYINNIQHCTKHSRVTSLLLGFLHEEDLSKSRVHEVQSETLHQRGMKLTAVSQFAGGTVISVLNY